MNSLHFMFSIIFKQICDLESEFNSPNKKKTSRIMKQICDLEPEFNSYSIVGTFYSKDYQN